MVFGVFDREKNGLWGFQPTPTQTSLSVTGEGRKNEFSDLLRKKKDCNICEAKTKISLCFLYRPNQVFS